MKTPFLVLLAGFALVGCQTQETSAPAETATPTPAKTVPVPRNLAVGATPKSVTSGKYFVTLMGVWNGPSNDALLAADSDGSLSRWITCSRIHGPNTSHAIGIVPPQRVSNTTTADGPSGCPHCVLFLLPRLGHFPQFVLPDRWFWRAQSHDLTKEAKIVAMPHDVILMYHFCSSRRRY